MAAVAPYRQLPHNFQMREPNVQRDFKDMRLFSDYSLLLVWLVVGAKQEELTFIEKEEVVMEMIRAEQCQ